MKNLNLLCMGCMREKPSEAACPYCHFDLEQERAKNIQRQFYLQPGSILNGRYLVGRVLGEGGFGITYIGWNLKLEIPVAVKEYFPKGFARRDIAQSDKISVLESGKRDGFYEKQKEKFLDEARMLGRFEDVEAIVSVRDYFEGNGTAYIVMEYLDGEDFLQVLKKNGGKLPTEQVFDMMEPIIEALIRIHKCNGLIHRDISPQNIRITSDGRAKLMDFGAAREAADEKSFSILLKRGYAPEEQYRRRGNQGPWTDVYAICATIYRAITGENPQESIERIKKDNIKKPSEMGILINKEQENALMKGLALYAQDRWQSMEELYNAIYNTKAGIGLGSGKEKTKIPLWKKKGMYFLVGAAMICGGVFAVSRFIVPALSSSTGNVGITGIFGNSSDDISDAENETGNDAGNGVNSGDGDSPGVGEKKNSEATTEAFIEYGPEVEEAWKALNLDEFLDGGLNYKKVSSEQEFSSWASEHGYSWEHKVNDEGWEDAYFGENGKLTMFYQCRSNYSNTYLIYESGNQEQRKSLYDKTNAYLSQKMSKTWSDGEKTMWINEEGKFCYTGLGDGIFEIVVGIYEANYYKNSSFSNPSIDFESIANMSAMDEMTESEMRAVLGEDWEIYVIGNMGPAFLNYATIVTYGEGKFIDTTNYLIQGFENATGEKFESGIGSEGMIQFILKTDKNKITLESWGTPAWSIWVEPLNAPYHH